MSPEPALAGVQGRSAGLRRDVGRDRRRIRCHGRVRGCGADDGDVRGKRGVGDCVHTDRVYDHLEAAAAALGGPPLQMGERVGVHCSKIRPIGSEGVLFKVIWQGADAAIGPTFEELGMGDGWPMVFARWPADLDP